MFAEQVVRDDQRPAASADAPRPASDPIALPVAALSRGATPPIRASADGRGASIVHPRADGRGAGGWAQKRWIASGASRPMAVKAMPMPPSARAPTPSRPMPVMITAEASTIAIWNEAEATS